MTITIDQLVATFPATKKATLAIYPDAINETCAKFDISTLARQSMFLAQIGHESGGFVFVAENLNYSAQGLRKIFGKYFPTDALAASYARKPEMIASRVYASRMGNGDEASKEGWTYRGRGLIQITGKGNYTAMAKYFEKTLAETVEFLENPIGAVMSAGWFWSANGLNAYADQNRFSDMTKKINGGLNGIDDRKAIWARAKVALG